MKPLRQQFIDALQLSGYTEHTIENYLWYVTGITRHYKCNPLKLTKEQIQDYLLFVHQQKKYAPATINLAMNALKSFYRLLAPHIKTMDGIGKMKQPRHLPVVLSLTEVERMIATIRNVSAPCDSYAASACPGYAFAFCYIFFYFYTLFTGYRRIKTIVAPKINRFLYCLQGAALKNRHL